MRLLLYSLIACSISCASLSVRGACGVELRGDWFAQHVEPEAIDASTALDRDTLDRAVNAALDAATFTTDFRLMDQTENCKALDGLRVFTVQEPSFTLSTGRVVNGVSDCLGHYVLVGTPTDGAPWSHSALVHEFLHAMQQCSPPLPIDDRLDADHANWKRDHFYDAIDRSRGTW